MGELTVDAEHLRSWIGNSTAAVETITPGLVERFRATFDLPASPSYEVAPGLHWCLSAAAAATAELGTDGHPKRGGFLPPVPLPRRMWAGGEVEFRRPLRVGDSVRRTSTIADVTVKQGRTGALCFVAVHHEFRVEEELVILERQDIVYRGTEGGGAKPTFAVRSAAAAPFTRRLTPTPVLLFRYSALTFNGHRIHYDRPYACEQEGYPALVLHGPLQASLLLHFATALRQGVPPTRFAFRSAGPAFDNADLTLNADPVEYGLKLWTAAPSSAPAMIAEARWDTQ